MLWAALLLETGSDPSKPQCDAQAGLATWALQFTPRVALVSEPVAVVMEVAASTRLFGGRQALCKRIETEAALLGVRSTSWASNSVAALALATAGLTNGFQKPLAELLDALPLDCMPAVGRHQATLARLGCRTLSQVRAIPRGGIGRRFDAQLLTSLDQAYGLRPEAHTWFALPEAFRARLELPSRVEVASGMLWGAHRLLLQMCGWLAARHAGVTSYTLRWAHDAMRSRAAGEGGALTIRTAEPTRNLDHLNRLLAEHLAKVELLAPAGDLALEADEVALLEEVSGSLLPDARAGDEQLGLVLERIAARLGEHRVVRPIPHEDHRPEWMVHWQPVPQKGRSRKVRPTRWPQPTFVLDEPLRIPAREDRPLYQGPLQLLAGPHRIEGGWWHRVAGPGGVEGQHVQRDYWVAWSEHAGVLWIFQERLTNEEAAWYLHGCFA